MELTQRIKERLREVEDWNTLVDQLEADAGAQATEQAQSASYFELGRACEDIFLDKARAMHLYQNAFKLDRTNIAALRRARLIYHEMAKLDLVLRMLKLELKAVQNPTERSELDFAYGATQLNLGAINKAKPYLEAAFNADPSNTLYRERYQETQYDRDNWRSELSGIVSQLQAITGETDLRVAKVKKKGSEVSALFLRAARILQQESAGDDKLLPLLFKAIDSNPRNLEAFTLAETLLAADERPQYLQKLQDRRVSLLDDPVEKIEALKQAAEIWQLRLNHAEMSAYFFQQALDLAYEHPGYVNSDAGRWHIAAFRFLTAQTSMDGLADTLIPLAKRGITAVEDAVDRALLAEFAGKLAWQRFNDTDTARRLLEVAAEELPQHPTVLAFRAEFGAAPVSTPPEATADAEETDEAPQPVDDSDRSAEAEEHASPTEAAPVDASEPVADADAAESIAESQDVEASEAVAEPEPEPEPEGPVTLGDEEFDAEEMALIEKAQQAEEKGGKRALDAWRDVVAQMPERAYPRARLKQLYIDANRWSNVAELLKEQLKHTSDEALSDREAIHWELIALYREQLRQPGNVIQMLAALEQMFEDAGDIPRLLNVVEEQQKQFESMKRKADIIGRIRRRAELTDDMELRKNLHLEAGTLYLEAYNNQPEAIKSFEAALEVDEYDRTAITKLKELYGRRRDWEKMLNVQRKELALIEDPEERKAQLLEVARTAGAKIKRPSTSIELWTEVLSVDPDNTEALENLEAMQEREKDWPALAQTLERLIELTVDDGKKSQYLQKLGALYGDKLSDNVAAIRAWEALHELDPDSRRAQQELKKLYLAEGDMDALEAFYAKQDKWSEFVRVLEREADGAELDQRTSLLLKIADLYRTKLDKPDRAIRALEKALSEDDDHLVVAERLIELYEEANDERHLSKPLQIKLSHEKDEGARQALFRRLADLAERVASNPDEAFEYYRRAYNEEHRSEDVRAHLERLADATNHHAALAKSLEDAVEKYGSDPESIPLRVKLAEVYELNMADFDAALRTNRSILELDGEHQGALDSLEKLYINLGRDEDLLEILQTKLALGGEPELRRAIQTRIGALHEQLGQHAEAIAAYESVLTEKPDDTDVLAALDRLYVGLERHEELAGILERELEYVPPEDDATRAVLLQRLGVLNQEQIDRPREAVELFRRVLELDPAHDSARVRLESWLNHDELKVDVSRILLPIYESMEAYSEQVRCIEIQADAAESLEDRVSLRLRVGTLLAHSIGDTDRAFAVYARAFRDDPQNETAVAALEQLAALEDRWSDLAELYEDGVSRDLTSDLMRALLTRLARIYDQHLGNVDRAIACFQRAVDIDPGDTESLGALEGLYSRTENWAQLLEVYRAKVDLEHDPSAREALRFQIARLQEDMLGRRADAIATYNEILADDDVNLVAIQALDRLYQESEQWEELAENLARQLTLATASEQQVELNLRLGALQLRKLSLQGLAVETYQHGLELDPTNEMAIEALEGLMDDEEHQLSVARILEDIYKVASDWPKLVATYEIMVKHSLDPSEKIQLLHRIGELYELSGDDPSLAFQAFGRALSEDPGNAETQHRLDKLAGEMGAYEQLVSLYEGVVEDIVDDSLRVQILSKVAQTYEGALEQPTKAAQAYERILDIDPADFAAVDALIEVHRRTNAYDALVGAVKRKAGMVESLDDQKALLKYAAAVRESAEVQDPEGAVALYQQVLTIDDADREALDALVQLYLSLEWWEQLKDIYQRQSELAEGPEERKQALYVLGQVYDTELKDIDRAIDTYQAVLDIEPDDVQAIQALDRLYGQAERWLDQLQILESAVRAVQDAQDQTAYRFRIGGLWERELGDVVRAIEAYRDVLQFDPGHRPTIEALERIVRGDTEPMQAAQVLAPFYEQLADWEKLVEVYEIMVEHTEDPVARIERLHQTAALYENRLDNPSEAFHAYARAIATDATSDASLEQLERVTETIGDWARFAKLLDEQSERILDPVIKTKMLLRLAEVQEARLNDVEAAIGRYNAVLNEDPENGEAIDALHRIYSELGRWSDLVDNYRRQVAIASDEAQVIALYYQMGQVYQLRTNEPGRAVDAYREVLVLDSGHVGTQNALELMFADGQQTAEIAEILEPIYQQAEHWESLIKLGEVKLGVLDDPHERMQQYQGLAELCEAKMGDPSAAYHWWLRAYLDDPMHDEVTAELERLAEITQEWRPLVEVGEQILQSDPAPDVRLAVLARSAQVLDLKLYEPSPAIDVYRQVLAIEPEHEMALVALDRIYTQLSMAQDLAEILQRRLRITVNGDDLVELEIRLAGVFESQLGNADQAIAAYNRALENDPQNPTALSHLEALYMGQHMWQPLFDTYQRMADVTDSESSAANCYQRMAKLASDALDRETDAIDLWNRVLDIRGEDSLALHELARLHEKGERYESLVETLERQVHVIESDVERVAAYQTLGRIQAEKLEDHDRALDSWLQALGLDPSNLETLQALQVIYERNEAWPELVMTLERLVGLEAQVDQEERIALLAKIGRIEADKLLQTDRSIAAWLKVLELEPESLEAMAALERLYTEEGRWNDCISILERKARVSGDEEKMAALMQIAELWEERLEDRMQASGAYEEVLELDQSHPEAGVALERIYRETEQPFELAQLLITRAEHQDDVDERVATLQSAAKVIEVDLGSPEDAFQTLQTAFGYDYTNETTAGELERLATQYNKWHELLNNYYHLVQQLDDPTEKCELWVKIGRWSGEHIDPVQGVQALEQALAINPDSVSALRELSNFQRKASSFAELAQTLARIVPLQQEPSEQRDTLLDLADVQETQLGAFDGAIESYRRVLEVDSECFAALDALIRLHEQQHAWSDLVAAIAQRAAITEDPDDVLKLRKHIGYVQEAQIGDMPAAIETYKDILAQEPTDLDALQALERLYLNGNQIDEYLEILDAQLDATTDDATQIQIYEKMAHVLVTKADDLERATETLEKIITLDPSRDTTYRQLEELYERMERLTDLVETYRSHIEASADIPAKVELLNSMGQLYEERILDTDRAIETYQEIRELEPSNFEAAVKLSQLQESQEDWASAIETMGSLVELHPEPTAQIDMLTRMGRVLHEKLMSSDEAELRLNQALSLEPSHVPALVLLAEIYKSRADWLKAARTLETASEFSNNMLEKTTLAAEAAFINYEELENRAHAVELFAKTMTYDPEHIRVGRVLAGIYVEEGNAVQADPIYDMLTRKVEQLELDEEEQRDLFLHAAKVARSLGNADKALKQYKRAYDIDSNNQDVLVGMADLLFEREDWDRSFKLYQHILVQHRDTQPEEDTVRVYHRLGTIKNRQNEPQKALNYFEKALEVNPHHEETLASIIELRGKADDWEGVVEAKRALVDITPDGDAQFALWKDIGSCYSDKLGNKEKAADALQAALDIRPEDFPTMHELLELYTGTKRWEDAIRVLDRFVEVEPDGHRRSRYNYTAAVLFRDELGSIEDAIDRFNLVLDDDPLMLKAFQAIDTMLTKQRDWKALERSYRKMLKRLPPEGNVPLQVTLWSNLAEIYRSRLNDFKSAVAAFEIASRLDPTNVDRHIKMAELYERLMDYEPDEHVAAAVREHQILIANEPYRYESYHALFSIYVNARETDKAYCVGSVLQFLKQATRAEDEYVNQHRREGFVQARQRLSEETLRRHVFHPDQDLYLTSILGVIAAAVAHWRAAEPPAGLDPTDCIDISVDPSLFSRVAKYVQNVLNVEKPDVFLRPNENGDLELINLRRDTMPRPTLIVYQNLLRGKTEAHLAFALGRYMMELYLPHYCFVALERTPRSLKDVFMACLRAVGMPVQGDVSQLDQIARNIVDRMKPAMLDQLRSLLQKFIAAGGSTDVKRWAAAVELTTYRVGLLLCQDLRIAGQMISQEQAVLGSSMAPRDKIKELVLYSISEDYFAARRAIGVAVD